MRIDAYLDQFAGLAAGRSMHALASELYPICRSITGDGVRRTLEIVGREIPLEIHEVPSGTQVFDWTVPREWNIHDAWVKNSRGEKVIDFARSNLHVMSYSVPVHGRMSLEELRPHLHAMPDRPDWIPYRTSYYSENWGFCLPHRQLLEMEPGEYEVYIDSTLRDGHLTYGEYFLPGEREDEVLISCHVCHPSLSNDNLSGIAVATSLAKALGTLERSNSYRFLFIPGTIGSITWLSRNEARTARIRHGLVLTCVGDRGTFTYKKSRQGDADIDRAMTLILARKNDHSKTVEFSPFGYDERQFCSPGFNLPVGCLMRTEHGKFREYHTSADNLEFIAPEQLGGTFETCLEVFHVLENNARYRNLFPKCEPQLGKRGLYAATGGNGIRADNFAMLWVLNWSDGAHSLLDIAEKSGLAFRLIADAAAILARHGLLERVDLPASMPAEEARIVSIY
jgi:aminopeptidase-like protein